MRITIPNTPEGLEEIKRLKAEAKAKGKYLRVRGRGPRKWIFAQTGRVASGWARYSGGGMGYTFGLGSEEAPYATGWYLYYEDRRACTQR
jgi:hypothetical protein